MIIDGSREKPYFSILYFDPADKDFHIGYSSYYLDYVFNWLNEEFEIVEDENFVISALRPVGREQLDVVINSLKLRLENNEENGVVYIPKFAVEEMIERLEALCEDNSSS